MNKLRIGTGICTIIIILSIIMISGCTFDPGTLINQKKDNQGDIIQYTMDIQSTNNNSYNVKGMMENRGEKPYSDVNLTVIGYDSNKEKVSEAKIMLPYMPAHDYTDYNVWLKVPNGEKIVKASVEVVNATIT